MSADAVAETMVTITAKEYLQLVMIKKAAKKLTKAVGVRMSVDDPSDAVRLEMFKAFVECDQLLSAANKQTEASSRSADMTVKWEESK